MNVTRGRDQLAESIRFGIEARFVRERRCLREQVRREVNGARSARVPVAPHIAEQDVPREDAAAVLERYRSRRDSLAVSLTSWPPSTTVWRSRSITSDPNLIVCDSGSARFERRMRARIRATSSFGLNGFAM
jgi:hypothetical protein